MNNVSLSGDRDGDSEDQTCIKDSKMIDHKEKTTLQCLEPYVLQALHKLVSLVYESVNVSGQSKSDQPTSMKGVADNLKGKSKQDVTAILHLDDDPVAKILWNLKPLALRKIFLAMVVGSNSPVKPNTST